LVTVGLRQDWRRQLPPRRRACQPAAAWRPRARLLVPIRAVCLTTLGNPDLPSIVANLFVYNVSVTVDLLGIAFLVLWLHLTTDLFHRSSMLGSGYVYGALPVVFLAVPPVHRLSPDWFPCACPTRAISPLGRDGRPGTSCSCSTLSQRC
jgi:hypothetical protein